VTRVCLISHSPTETEELGKRFGAFLNRCSFIALRGDLGSGKTCFIRGIVAAVTPHSSDLVSSPTFAIMNEYPGDPAVFHFDFYRLARAGSEIYELGFEDYFHGNGICVVEWPERLEDLLPEEHLNVTLEYLCDDHRKLTFEASAPAPSAMLEHFSASLIEENFL
jgi:tRNA threonylcarbamoyladenosine biosynthesis protein TsaE